MHLCHGRFELILYSSNPHCKQLYSQSSIHLVVFWVRSETCLEHFHTCQAVYLMSQNRSKLQTVNTFALNNL